jgi:single-stranded-DNA-specific exonuclease
MKYKTYLKQTYPSMTEQVLYGRGITDVDAWLKANMNDVESWNVLDDIEKAVYELTSAIKDNWDTCIIVDCDVDGYTSAAILINFLYSLYPEWVNEHLIYLHHTGKQHGLTDMRDIIPKNTKLIICPDSASNDYEEHEYWNNQGTGIIILDHHEAPHVSKSFDTITINNQLCDYINKEFSGAGIVWQFCRAFNWINATEGDEGIDLCALGNCGDMMSYRSIETKAVIQEGLKQVTNPFFNELLETNEYTLNKYGGAHCYKAIAFAVVPFINATVRSGTSEEKDMIFKGMCKPWCFDKVPNTKRGHKGEEWPLYQQAAYLTAAIKRRQTKLETESMALLEKKIQEQGLLENSILVCCCEPGEVEPNIRGLAANKLASKYQRPCLVLTKSKTKDDNEYFYRGSGRNYSMSEVQDLKAVEESTGLIEYAQGHSNAMGVSIPERNLDSFIAAMNEKYKDVPREAVYWVDYIWNATKVDSNNLLQLAEMSNFWGQDVPASQVCIENIDLSNCQIRLCGTKNNTLRMILSNGLVLVKFGIDEDEYEQLLQQNTYMTCIISPQKNEWQGQISGEGIIDDYIIEQKWIF